MCEDYRSGAHADFEIDNVEIATREHRSRIPMLALGAMPACHAASKTPLDTTWKTLGENQCPRARRFDFRSFPDRGKSGFDGEGAERVFSRFVVRTKPAKYRGRHNPRKAVSSTLRPFDHPSALLRNTGSSSAVRMMTAVFWSAGASSGPINRRALKNSRSSVAAFAFTDRLMKPSGT